MQRKSFAWWIVAFFSFGIHCATSQEESYTCKRLVQETYRCKVYNYRHPLCKKWDHSQCPPPRVIRDYSQCVSYVCVRKKNTEWPVQTPTPTPSPSSTKAIISEESRLPQNKTADLDESSVHIQLPLEDSREESEDEAIKTLQDAIVDLRRVISCHKIFVI